jgi:protein TonB
VARCRTSVAEIAALADGSAKGDLRKLSRELAPIRGVYSDVFEQSLLLNQDAKRPWNFLASLSAELLVVSLVLLIPLLYRDHLPAFHWKDITVGPAPLPPPVERIAPTSRATSATLSPREPRPFYLDPRASLRPVEAGTTGDFVPDAPPSLSLNNLGGSTNMLGRFTPNVVAPPTAIDPPIETKKPPSAPLPVGGDVQMAKLVRKVIPEYPPWAKSARISGVVRLIGTIAKDGTIQNLQLVSGHPMLARAAMEAVQQWIYKPTLLNGNPVEVITPIEVSFTLEH